MCAVEWKKLGDVCEVGTGSNNREDACDKGLYPFYVRSKDVLRINKYLFDEEAIIIPGEGGIGDIFHYANGKYGLHQRAYRVHPIDGEVVCKYLYYYLSDKFKQYIVSKSVGATATSIRKPMLEGFMLPIPSLAKQQEIVSQLDTFTTLISNLESELDMHRKQYEHYRNQLLDFEGVEGVEWKSLGETCTLKARIGWQGLTKKEYREKGDYLLVTGTDFTDAHTIDFEHCVYVDRDRYEQDVNIQLKSGDVLITKDGTLGKVAYINSLPKPTTLNGGVFVVRDTTSKISQKFLMYYLVSGYFKNFIEHNHTNGTIKHLTQRLLVNFTIPIPSPETQQEIVEKLDAFEQLIQSLEQEIKLRKQQYEYYREKLLTFKKE